MVAGGIELGLVVGNAVKQGLEAGLHLVGKVRAVARADLDEDMDAFGEAHVWHFAEHDKEARDILRGDLRLGLVVQRGNILAEAVRAILGGLEVLLVDEVCILHVIALIKLDKVAIRAWRFSVVVGDLPVGGSGDGYVFRAVRQGSEQHVMFCAGEAGCLERAGSDLYQIGGLLLAVQRVGHGEFGRQCRLRSLNGRGCVFRALRGGKHGFGLRRRGERDHAEQHNCRKQER